MVDKILADVNLEHEEMVEKGAGRGFMDVACPGDPPGATLADANIDAAKEARKIRRAEKFNSLHNNVNLEEESDWIEDFQTYKIGLGYNYHCFVDRKVVEPTQKRAGYSYCGITFARKQPNG